MVGWQGQVAHFSPGRAMLGLTCRRQLCKKTSHILRDYEWFAPLSWTQSGMEAGLACRGGCARVGGSTILSTVPANSTTGVNPNLAVKFTFSEAMNPSLTTLQFFDSMAPTTHLTTTPAWSAGQNTYGQARTPRPSTCVAR